MIFKLSIIGLKSKLKDYIILLVGLVMSIAIFYMFQTLALNKAFLEANATIKSIGYVFQTGSVLLAMITFFYVFYANSFLLSLRQKEFGMYMTLGAKRNKISLLVFMETALIGAASLVIGIIVGSGLAQGIGKLLMEQLDFTAHGYQALYIPSMTVTCIFFCLLFLLSAVMNSIKLSRISILQLVHGDTYADSIIIKGKMTGIVALFSLILLGIGYASMVYMDQLKESGIMIAMLSTTAGTYLVFEALFPLFVKKLKENKSLNERGLNAFTLAQLNFRINGLTKVLATVAMLIALGAGAISGGMAFKNNVMKSTDHFQIYDTVINNPTTKEMEVLDSISFKEKGEYRYKADDHFFYYVKEDLEKNPPFTYVWNGEENTDKLKRVSETLSVGSVSAYSQENKQNTKIIPDEWEDALRNMQPIYIDVFNKPIKIIDLKMYQEIQGIAGIIFTGKTDDFVRYTKEWKKLDEWQLTKYKDVKADEILSKYKIYYGFYSVASGIVFMGFFLGFAFLAMMASCLMFKILSEATTDMTRYKMLRKIGVRRELLSKSIYKELFIVFLVPAIIGMSHVLIGMNIFGFILHDPYYRIWLPIVIFLIVYIVYYLITVHLYKRIVLPKIVEY